MKTILLLFSLWGMTTLSAHVDEKVLYALMKPAVKLFGIMPKTALTEEKL